MFSLLVFKYCSPICFSHTRKHSIKVKCEPLRIVGQMKWQSTTGTCKHGVWMGSKNMSVDSNEEGVGGKPGAEKERAVIWSFFWQSSVTWQPSTLVSLSSQHVLTCASSCQRKPTPAGTARSAWEKKLYVSFTLTLWCWRGLGLSEFFLAWQRYEGKSRDMREKEAGGGEGGMDPSMTICKVPY